MVMYEIFTIGKEDPQIVALNFLCEVLQYFYFSPANWTTLLQGEGDDRKNT